MLSLETAKKLKAAGLRWNPQVGDYGARLGKNEYILLKYFYVASTQMDHINTVWCDDDGITGEVTGLWNSNKFVWLPRLGQLLAEIKKREYECFKLEYWRDWNEKKGGWVCMIWNGGYDFEKFYIVGNSPDEAAAQALIWILEQEANA